MFLHHTVPVPVNRITQATSAALVYATAISEDVRALYVEATPGDAATMRTERDSWGIGVPLDVVPSPYRSVLKPLVRYVDDLTASGATDLVSIVVPEIVPRLRDLFDYDESLDDDRRPGAGERRRSA